MKKNNNTPISSEQKNPFHESPEANSANEDIRVEWFGADGGLILLYFILAAIYTYGIIYRVDIIVGIVAPAIAFGITAAIFIRYCFEVFHFTRSVKKKK